MNRPDKTPYEIATFLKTTNFGAALQKTPESIWAVLVHTARHSLQVENEPTVDPLPQSERNLKGARFFRQVNIVKLAFRLLQVEHTIMEVLVSKEKAEKAIVKMIRFGRYQAQVAQALAPHIKKMKEKETMLQTLRAKTLAQQKTFDNLILQKKDQQDKYKQMMIQVTQIHDDGQRKRTVMSNLQNSRNELSKQIHSLQSSQATSALQMKSLQQEIKLLEGQIFENTSQLRALLQQKQSEFQSKSNRLLMNSDKQEERFKNNVAVIEGCLREIRGCQAAADTAAVKHQQLKDRKRELFQAEQVLTHARNELATLHNDISSIRSKTTTHEQERASQKTRLHNLMVEEQQEAIRLQEEISGISGQVKNLQGSHQEAVTLLERGYSMIAKEHQEFYTAYEQMRQSVREISRQQREFSEKVVDFINDAFP